MRISDWSSDVCSSDLKSLGMQVLESQPRVRFELDAPAHRHGVTHLCEQLRRIRVIRPFKRLRAAQSHRAPTVDIVSRNPRAHHELQMVIANRPALAAIHGRSEEHTSELQSLMRTSYPVFCLKKKHTTQSAKYSKQKK